MSLITKEQLEEFIKSFPGWVKERDYFTRDRQIPPGDNYTFYTPINVVNEMLDLLPEETWKKSDWTFLCLPCKDGIFLEEIFWRLYEGLKEEIPDYIDRTDHILTKQLYGLSPCYVPKDVESLTILERSINKKLYGRERFKSYAENSRILLYGGYRANHPKAYTKKFDNPYGNIWAMYKIVDGYVRDTFEIVKDKGKKTLRDLAEGVDKDMKFNVVIGNPPYNKGMDLDFVNLGFDLCTDYCVMITPAKWQTAADDYQGCASKTIDYKGFREKLVPHMSKVVFYFEPKDVFNIQEKSGITYYILDKNKTYTECEVENICSVQKYFNSKEKRSINNRETLINVGNSINNYLESKEKFKFEYGNKKGRYEVWVATQISAGGGSKSDRAMLTIDGGLTCIGATYIIDKDKNEESPSGTSSCVFRSDSKEECKSFASWLNTKFTRFFVAINISKLTGILTDDYFRFVPSPPPTASGNPWDHIYTDEELYKAFNLPQKYIDVIEAVIKERKWEMEE